MKNNLLKKLQSYKKDSQKKKKENININASFTTLTDEEIQLVLALRAKKLRIKNNLKQKDFSIMAKLSSPTTYANFEQTGKISFINFIKILRAFGKISELENMLQDDITSKIENYSLQKKEKKRVR